MTREYKFFSWIYRIAVNESLNLLRRNRREDALDDEVEPYRSRSGRTPSERLGEAQLSRRIQVALMHMSTNDRMVLTLRHFSECSYEEIGQILDLGRKDGEVPPFRGAEKAPQHADGLEPGLR